MASSSKVVIISGTNRLETETDCETVGAIRSDFAEALNIPAGAAATVNGSRADDNTRVCPGDEVSFTKATGSKG